ncbi:MAG: glycosyltransferase family 4 protein [Saprospiraceae bacterium]|nr:glycosyltransferase family 4 protein [Saprospiraceae bacterium]
MTSLRFFFNKFIKLVYQNAIDGQALAILVLKYSRLISRIPYGLYCFRIGEISKSLKTLKKSKFNAHNVNLSIARSKEILKKLDGSNKIYLSKECNYEKSEFNHSIIFACHSNGYFHPNGYAFRTKEIATALSNSQVEIHAMTRLGYPWDLAEHIQTEKVKTTKFGDLEFKHFEDKERSIAGPESIYIQRYAEIIAEEAQKSHSSVIHAHSNYINGHAAAQAGNRLGIPSVFEMRGLWHLSRAVKEPIFQGTEHYQYLEKMEIEAAMLCDRVVTLNQSLKSWLISKGVEESKISVVPNSVHLRNEDYIHSQTNDVYTFGFAGSITAYEGLDDLIEAIRLLKNKGVPIKLRVAGSGTYFSTLKKLVTDYKLEKQIKLLGRIPNSAIEEFYKTVDAIVIPRKDYKVTRLVTPLKLVEAMNYGKPVVCSNLPALKEVVSDGIDGLLFQSGSAADLALTLEDLMARPDKGLSLARAAHEKIANDFNWQKSAKEYLKIYNNFYNKTE